MRRLALVGLVAACGHDPGLLLDLHGTSGVVKIEVFLPNGTAGDGMGLPPGGAAAAKKPGTIYTVIDRVEATAKGGTATILLQRGDLSEVPALLVLGYNAQHEPIASAVITGPLKLPTSQEVELKVTLDPTMYVAPSQLGGGNNVARWSSTAPNGDTSGPCIAVTGATNAFFSIAGDLDCDAKTPDCDDTSFDFVGGAAPTNNQCAAEKLYPQMMDACTIGSTIACTDGVGTCGPRMVGSGAGEVPICVPDTLCKHCKNSNSITGTSGIDPTCEAAARVDQDTIRIDCRLLATMAAGSNTVSPCFDLGTPLDLPAFTGPGWGCAGAPMYWFTNYGITAPSSFLAVGGTPGSPDYRVDAHCNASTGSLAFSFTATQASALGTLPTTDVVALFAFPMHAPTTVTPFAQLAIPFRLSYEMTDMCPQPPTMGSGMTCQIKAPSGNPADDPIWKGCAGAP